LRREWLVLALALCVETSLSGEKTLSVLACIPSIKAIVSKGEPAILARFSPVKEKVKAEQGKAKQSPSMIPVTLRPHSLVVE
jgi:hypothetical protein